MRDWIQDGLFLVGGAAIAYGLHQVYPPAMWIFVGLGALLVAVLLGARSRRRRRRGEVG